VVDNNIALRKTLGITSSMGLEFAKWNVEPWDWGFPNFTARNTTREFQLRLLHSAHQDCFSAGILQCRLAELFLHLL
jgi:hypothetical protein